MSWKKKKRKRGEPIKTLPGSILPPILTLLLGGGGGGGGGSLQIRVREGEKERNPPKKIFF